MDYNKVIQELSTIFKTKEQASDYTWLVFLYDLNLVNNVLYHLHYKKDEALRVPERYSVAYADIADYYNRYYGGKNGKTQRI